VTSKTRIHSLALAIVLATTTYAQQAKPASASTAAIDKVLADAVARGDIPGVVAMVTDRRGIVYQGAFGVADAGSGRPMTVDTVFRIASMTKPVTSLAVMQLIEQGRLSLDDPAEKYLHRCDDGAEPHRQRRCARGEDGDARAQQRLHVCRRWARQVGDWVHDHRREQAGARKCRKPELGLAQ
jgi:CubicO group peptidase (beta-lactamase class C family)